MSLKLSQLPTLEDRPVALPHPGFPLQSSWTSPPHLTSTGSLCSISTLRPHPSIMSLSPPPIPAAPTPLIPQGGVGKGTCITREAQPQAQTRAPSRSGEQVCSGSPTCPQPHTARRRAHVGRRAAPRTARRTQRCSNRRARPPRSWVGPAHALQPLARPGGLPAPHLQEGFSARCSQHAPNTSQLIRTVPLNWSPSLHRDQISRQGRKRKPCSFSSSDSC